MSAPRRLRSYALTGGRTHAPESLSMETLVVAGDAPANGDLSPELRAIHNFCDSPQSLVDISAHLDMPLGVVRVLVGDLISEGLLDHTQEGQDAAVPVHRDLDLLGELLEGIEAL